VVRLPNILPNILPDWKETCLKEKTIYRKIMENIGRNIETLSIMFRKKVFIESKI